MLEGSVRIITCLAAVLPCWPSKLAITNQCCNSFYRELTYLPDCLYSARFWPAKEIANMKQRIILSWISTCVLGLLWMPAQMAAQSVYGSMFGTVADASGAIVPGAHITVTNI